LHVMADAQWIPARDLTAAWRNVVEEEGWTADHTDVKRWRAYQRGWAERMVDEGLKGTKGDLKRLSRQFKRVGGSALFEEAIASFHGVPWFRALGKAVGKVGRRERKPCYCPRCGARFDRWEWVRHGPYDVEAVEIMRIRGPTWNDFYGGFVHEPEQAEIFKLPAGSEWATSWVA